jgi:hypothetical protein
MTPTAVTFLILAALIIWGGLIVSIVRLRRDGAATHDEASGEGAGLTAPTGPTTATPTGPPADGESAGGGRAG